jgi:regulator of cell morphogenesis and NO signaling
MNTEELTVGQIASRSPVALRVLERHHVDFCCGGARPLVDAAKAAGTSAQEILAEIEREEQSLQPAAENHADKPTPALIAHIIDVHHIFTRKELTRLAPLVEKVVRVHGQRHEELPRVLELFDALAADLWPHLIKEENVLFPYVAALDRAAQNHGPMPRAPFGTVKNPVRMMDLEHEAVGVILEELRGITDGYLVPADACMSYRAMLEGLAALDQDLRRHIHLESNVLFPRALTQEKRLVER